MKISTYKPEYEQKILAAISQDPDWDIFTNENTINSYKAALKNSVTYICHQDDELLGYARAILDEDTAVYISELFVVPEWRNQTIGRSLIERIKVDFTELTVYALSDEDAYYEKIGYEKIGSVFLIK